MSSSALTPNTPALYIRRKLLRAIPRQLFYSLALTTSPLPLLVVVIVEGLVSFGSAYLQSCQ